MILITIKNLRPRAVPRRGVRIEFIPRCRGSAFFNNVDANASSAARHKKQMRGNNRSMKYSYRLVVLV
jgi:hypothetical protein